ncbi:hypothetical protein [Nibrella saemangeumensis]
MNIIFIVMEAAVILLILYEDNQISKLAQLRQQRTAQLEHLRHRYAEALVSGNRGAALRAGQAYYRFLRNGQLTTSDEQAITDDLMLINP